MKQKKPVEKFPILGFRDTEGFTDKINAIAVREHLSVSQVMRRIVREYFAKNGK